MVTFRVLSLLFVTSFNVQFNGELDPLLLVLLLLELEKRFDSNLRLGVVMVRGEIGGRPCGDELTDAKRVLSGVSRFSSKAASAELTRCARLRTELISALFFCGVK